MGACPFLRAGFWGLGGGQRRGWAGTEGASQPGWVGGGPRRQPRLKNLHIQRGWVVSHPTPPLTLMQEERKEKKVMRGPVNNERDGVRVDVSGAE